MLCVLLWGPTARFTLVTAVAKLPCGPESSIQFHDRTLTFIQNLALSAARSKLFIADHLTYSVRTNTPEFTLLFIDLRKDHLPYNECQT